MKEGTKSAAIYARLSVDRDGKKVGIDTQLEDSRRLAKERGWTIVDEYIDRNLTAADKLVARPEYNRLVADFEARRFDALVCWDLDRLTRQPRQLEDWIDAAESREVVLVTANGEADLGTDGGRLYARLKVAVAKGETERASARQKRSKQARRESGKWHGGPAPFGYRAKDSTLVPEPREKELIEEAAKRLLEGESLHSIVKDWNNPTVPGGIEPKNPTRKGEHWRQSNLRRMLLNRSLLGETKAGVPGWEPVIDQRTFDRLTRLLTDPSRKVTHSPGVKGGKYSMGGGLTVCGRCDKSLISASKKVRGGAKVARLACLRRVNGAHPAHAPVEVEVTRDGEKVKVWQDSGRVTIEHAALEAHVFEEVFDRLSRSGPWAQRLSKHNPETEKQIDDLERERADLRDQRERAGRSYVLGIMPERDAQAEVARLDALIDGVDRQLGVLLTHPVVEKVVTDGIDWDSMTPGSKRTFLRYFIEKVVVNEWPKGRATTLIRKRSNETAAEFKARRAEHRAKGMKDRVKIVWR